MEYGGVNASSVGLGAGLGLSLGHGMALTHGYQAAASAQAAIVDKSRAIEQYMQMGYNYEARKQWDSAEKAYRYALQVVASRDGPGSPKSVPALQHLVSIATEQQRWNEALDMQKMVVQFAKKNQNDFAGTVKEQINLSKLFIQTNNLPQAEANLRESITLCDSHPSIPAAQRDQALSQYAQVLRQMDTNKTGVESPGVTSSVASTDKAASVNAGKPALSTGDSIETASLDPTAKRSHHKKTDQEESNQVDQLKNSESIKETGSTETPKIPDATEVLGAGTH